RGISGPVVLQISNNWQPGDEIEVDLLPGVDAGELLVAAKRRQGRQRLRTVLAESLAKGVVLELQALWWPGEAERTSADLGGKAVLVICERRIAWRLSPSATEGCRNAEVTLGGYATNTISSRTMECRDQTGLYFIGEVLDVTGHLGGYNFQWS